MADIENKQLICGGPRFGKTTKLVEQAKKTGAYIVVPNKQMADYLRDKHDFHNAVTIGSLLSERGIFRKEPKSVYFDNADYWLKSLFNQKGYRLEKYTVSDNPYLIPIPDELKKAIESEATNYHKHYLGDWVED